MNRFGQLIRIVSAFALATFLALAPAAFAQSTWTGAVSGSWDNADN